MSKKLNLLKFVSTNELENHLFDMISLHAETDFCVLGTRGSGKSILINEFAQRLNYFTETIVLYQVIFIFFYINKLFIFFFLGYE